MGAQASIGKYKPCQQWRTVTRKAVTDRNDNTMNRAMILGKFDPGSAKGQARKIVWRCPLPGNRFARGALALTFACLFGGLVVAEGSDFVKRGHDVASRTPEVITEPRWERYGDHMRKFQGIPGIERAENGRLWATWYANNVVADEGPDNYVVLVSSDDDGETWSRPRLVIDPEGLVRAFDPVLWIDPTGRMWLFWSQSHSWWDGRGGVWAMTTDNPGHPEPTWSRPRRLFNGVMMNKLTVLSTGEWLAPAAVWKREIKTTGHRPIKEEHVIFRKPDEMFSNVWRSTDRGDTWEFIGKADVPDRLYDEHMILEREDDSLWMLVRTRYGIGESFSDDRGITWTPGEPSEIDHVSARFFIRRLQSGNVLLIKHDPPEDDPGRSHLTAFLSTDDGESWEGGLVLDERLGVSYPDAIETDEGVIYAIYDYDRRGERKILMAVFDEKDVREGELVSEGSRLKVLVNQAGGDG